MLAAMLLGLPLLQTSRADAEDVTLVTPYSDQVSFYQALSVPRLAREHLFSVFLHASSRSLFWPT